jgi:hypothetical protein
MDGSEILGYCEFLFFMLSEELKAWNSGRVTRSLYWYKAKVKAAQRDQQRDLETGSPLKSFGFPLLLLF